MPSRVDSLEVQVLYPVLLIHGREDSHIRVRRSERIAARNPKIVLWEVPKADHCDAFSVSPKEFETKLIAWFQSHAQP